MQSKFKLVVAFCCCFALQSLQADSLYSGKKPIPEPVKIVESQTNILLEQLSVRREEFQSEPEKLIQFARQIALKHWDLEKVSRLILGPVWKTATESQRKAFSEEFLRTLLRYVVRAYGYYDEDLLEVINYQWQPTGRGGWVLSKVKIPGGLKVAVDYRMQPSRTTGQWRLIDIRAEGINLIKAKRSEYRPLAQSKGLEVLIKAMAEKNEAVLGEILQEDPTPMAKQSN